MACSTWKLLEAKIQLSSLYLKKKCNALCTQRRLSVKSYKARRDFVCVSTFFYFLGRGPDQLQVWLPAWVSQKTREIEEVAVVFVLQMKDAVGFCLHLKVHIPSVSKQSSDCLWDGRITITASWYAINRLLNEIPRTGFLGDESKC